MHSLPKEQEDSLAQAKQKGLPVGLARAWRLRALVASGATGLPAEVDSAEQSPGMWPVPPQRKQLDERGFLRAGP